jgi:NADPH:quinone reductase-like Zn-dependent oxidoreductase
VRFRPGDKVLTYTWQTGYFGGTHPGYGAETADMGVVADGTFREHGVFNQEGLVHMPDNLSFEEGAALNIAYVTAWNALMGGTRPLRVGDTVLVQGTGGVSVAALQLAVAAGATVIATTSSAEKEAFLTGLGARHVINYKQDSEWGATAKKLSPRGLGCTKVIEIGGGQGTCRQSFNSLALGGEIEVIGFLAHLEETGQQGPSFFETILRSATIRGFRGGSREQFDELCRVIESRDIRPAIDPRIFQLVELKSAYQHLWERKQVGKVVISIPA